MNLLAELRQLGWAGVPKSTVEFGRTQCRCKSNWTAKLSTVQKSTLVSGEITKVNHLKLLITHKSGFCDKIGNVKTKNKETT